MNESEDILIQQLQARLEDLERENKALLKVASHDVRSPLNKLFALVSLFKMSSEGLNEEQRSYLEKMEIVMTDGLGRMKNLMDLRAIEEDSVETLIEQINVGALTGKIIREYTTTTKRKNIRIIFDEQRVITGTDRLSITRILDQLLSNALKFTPRDNEIVVKLTEKSELIIIAITDGGYGISMEEQENLYKKFIPLSARPTGGESTTGLGLYIAQWNAKNLGGEIIYSNTNGSTFNLHLPKVSLA